MKAYRKAILAFLVAGVGSLATGAIDNQLTLAEWLAAAATAVGAAAAVYAIPNKPAGPQAQ